MQPNASIIRYTFWCALIYNMFSLNATIAQTHTLKDDFHNLFLLASQHKNMQLLPSFSQLSFESPIDFKTVPLSDEDDDEQVPYNIVLEHGGKLKIFEDDEQATSIATYLDLSQKISPQGESGLLGLAFDPDFIDNQYVYIQYNTESVTGVDCFLYCTVVSRFKQITPKKLDPNSEYPIISVPQTSSNYLGGDIAFGPNDGFLYISIGDNPGEVKTHSQNRTNLLGSIIRIAIDEEQGYLIPSDNPFFLERYETEGPGKGKPVRKEIWAYGFRNPSRFSFDSFTGLLWLGDIGQHRYEEIDVIAKGNNYGWPIFEGPASFDPHHPTYSRVQRQYIRPISYYGRKQGNSIRGGFVYRDDYYSNLEGQYVYGDFGSGRLWALPTNSANSASEIKIGRRIELANGKPGISSIGLGHDGEIIVVNKIENRLMKLVQEQTQTASLPKSSSENPIN